MPERIWILTAPPGRWSSGPLIVRESQLDGFVSVPGVQNLIDLGWTVEGPFVQAADEAIPGTSS